MKLLPSYTCNTSNFNNVQKNKTASNPPAFGNLNVEPLLAHLNDRWSREGMALLFDPKKYNIENIFKNLQTAVKNLGDKFSNDGLPTLLLSKDRYASTITMNQSRYDGIDRYHGRNVIFLKNQDHLKKIIEDPEKTLEIAYKDTQKSIENALKIKKMVETNPLLKRYQYCIKPEVLFESEIKDYNGHILGGSTRDRIVYKFIEGADSALKEIIPEAEANGIKLWELSLKPFDWGWGMRSNKKSHYSSGVYAHSTFGITDEKIKKPLILSGKKTMSEVKSDEMFIDACDMPGYNSIDNMEQNTRITLFDAFYKLLKNIKENK